MTTQTSVNNGTLTVERTYDAPRKEVFEAWIDAAKTRHWWGCSNTTKVESTIEPKENGRYQHLMHIHGVCDHLIIGTILEYSPPEFLSYRLPPEGELPEMLVQVTFDTIGTKTKVTLVQSPLPEFLHKVVAEGWTASFERLYEYFAGYRRAA